MVDLPIARERITSFPVIPASSLKGVLLQHARTTWGDARKGDLPPEAKVLFGAIDTIEDDSGKKQVSNAGCLQIMEGKLLAFPVRSLAGCFAWITCPAALERFQRDSGMKFKIPRPSVDRAIVPGNSELTIPGKAEIVLEEYALGTLPAEAAEVTAVAQVLAKICSDPLWSNSLLQRLAIIHDENFQHFVNTCTEVVTRIKIDPATRTVDGGALFNQENVPCETVFYSILTVLPPRRIITPETQDPNLMLAELLPEKNPPILQIGGDETTGHGQCDTKREVLP